MSVTTVPAFYLGFLKLNSIGCNTSSRSIEETLIELLENEQISGKIPKLPNADSKVIIEMSKYGLKMICSKTKDVKMRIPLLHLLLYTTFNDGFGKINGIILESYEKRQKRYIPHLIQFENENDADFLCNNIKDLFRKAEEVKILMDVTEPPSPSIDNN